MKFYEIKEVWILFLSTDEDLFYVICVPLCISMSCMMLYKSMKQIQTNGFYSKSLNNRRCGAPLT